MAATSAGDRADRRLSRADRRRAGAFYTPEPVARALVELAAVAVSGPIHRALDPACGDGAFLTLFAERGWVPVGVDLDRSAIAAASARVPGAELAVGDALLDARPTDGSFDLVVGNPPFLGSLKSGTAPERDRRGRLSRRYPSGGPYADEATRFVEAAIDWVRPGGVVALILPGSFLSARDASGVRRRLLEEAEPVGLWWPTDEVFDDASVRVCALLARRRRLSTPDVGAARAAVDLYGGRIPEPAGAGPSPRHADGWGRTVAPLLGLPSVEVCSSGLLGDITDATAGFRDEFYELAAGAVDEVAGPGARLVTSGLIDPAHVAWGERPVRLGGRRLAHPRLDPASRLSDRVARYVERQRGPKVLVATQTRVVEAAVDTTGDLLAVTPVLVATPHDGIDPWLIAAALSAPPVSVLARHLTIGSGLSGEAIKLSARQMLDLPVPVGERRWRAAADELAAGRLGVAGRLLTAAYLDRPPGDEAVEEVLAWWAARLPRGMVLEDRGPKGLT